MSGPLLICCEGETEVKYFQILRARIFRIPRYFRIEIHGRKGQHKALVDKTVELRRSISSEDGVPEDEIECWAVCDDDDMSFSYAELLRYAEENGVNLAFSRPQFESYILQHFEQSRETVQRKIIERIEAHMAENGAVGGYEKTDLKWLESVLIDRPKLVDVAVTNADRRIRQSSSPFLTVQNLTRRLMELRLD